MHLAPARHILLCLRYGIGDAVMETPVLQALREAAPQARITVLAAPPAHELLAGDPRVDEVASTRQWGLTHRWDAGDEASRAAIGAWLDEHEFDLYLDVHHAVTAIGTVVWSRGIQSFEADEAAEAAAVARGADGVAAIKAAVWAGWGLEVPGATLPRLCLRPQDRWCAKGLLREHALDGRALIGISPVASHVLKRWPTERLAEVADRLVEETNGWILLFYGRQKKEAQRMMQRMHGAQRVIPVGALHLLTIAALLAECRAFVCNDTGLMHMAAAVGTPTIAVFGPTAPNLYRPPAYAIGVGGNGIECPHRNTRSLHPAGCWTSDRCLIAEHGCIHRVGVEEVLAAVQDALSGSEMESHALSA